MDKKISRAEAIRFAVVLNGGVSLAVWMGGTVVELDRLIHNKGVYGAFNDFLSLEVRADVITGTSAGGINGACLALAQANKKADLTLLREIWLEQGRMESLLRQPFRGAPTSLLRGDEYFLPELTKAFRRLATPFVPTCRTDFPVELTITTTLLHGAPRQKVDALGQNLFQSIHEGRFNFSRNDSKDDFDCTAHDLVPEKLAFASRCTAGFPMAFEPTLVPVNRANGAGSEGGRPDMAAEATWAERSSDPVPDRSRYVIDGGVLTNTPTREALRAIGDMPASEPIQRVMMLVFPHAPESLADKADTLEQSPTLAGTIAGVVGAWSSQSSRTYVEEIDLHNRKAAAKRGARYDVLTDVGKQPSGETEFDPTTPLLRLHDLAAMLLPHFRSLRMRRVARDFADRFSGRTGITYDKLFEDIRRAHQPPRHEGEPVTPYASATLPTFAEGFVESLDVALPAEPPGWAWGLEGAWDICDCCLDLLKRIAWAVPAEDLGEVKEARKVIHAARAEIRNQRDSLDDAWENKETRPHLASIRPDEAYWRARLALYSRRIAGDDSDDCAQAFAVLVANFKMKHPDTNGGEDRRVSEFRQELDELLRGEASRKEARPGDIGTALRQQVLSAIGAVCKVLPIFDRVGKQKEVVGLREVEAWKVMFAGMDGPQKSGESDASSPRPEDWAPVLLCRFLWLHVASWTIGDETTEGNSFPIELIQLSLQTQNAFATVSTEPRFKVGGMSVNRFGGFLKRSWRANDWIWGRIDAATTLTRVIFSEPRVSRYDALAALDGDRAQPSRESWTRGPGRVKNRDSAEVWVDELCGRLFQDWGAPAWDTEAIRPLREAERAAREELITRKVFDQDNPPEDDDEPLAGLATLAAWALHMEIILEELPKLEESIALDRVEGASTRSRGEAFLAQHANLLDRVREQGAKRADSPKGAPLTSEQAAVAIEALTAFDRAGVGHDELVQEGSSDQMIRTATTAVAVAVTVADSDNSGLTPARPVTRALRGAMLLPYWTIRALTSGGTTVRYLALLTLAFGAVLLSMSILGVLPSWLSGVGASVGVGSLLCAFAYGAFRSGTLLHGFVLLTPIVPVVALAVDKAGHAPEATDRAAVQHGLTSAAILFALALGLVVLGSLPSPIRSFASWYDGLSDRAVARFGRGGRDPRLLGETLSHTRVRDEYGWPKAGAAVRLVARLALPVVVFAAVAAAAVGLVLLVISQGHAFIDHLRAMAVSPKSQRLGGGLGVGAVLLGVGCALGWIGGRSLRVCQPVVPIPGHTPEPGVRTQTWETRPVEHPAGVTATWSVVYGVVYFLVAWVLLVFAPRNPHSPYLVTTVVLFWYAVVLLVVIPWQMPRVARRRIEDDAVRLLALSAEIEPARDRRAQRTEGTTLLLYRFPAYRFLFKPDDCVRIGLLLTRRGGALVARARALRAISRKGAA